MMAVWKMKARPAAGFTDFWEIETRPVLPAFGKWRRSRFYRLLGNENAARARGTVFAAEGGEYEL